MRKTSVYLSDDEAEGLRRAARAEGKTQSELIREGIRRVISDHDGQRLFSSLGKGRGGGAPVGHRDGDQRYRKVMGDQ